MLRTAKRIAKLMLVWTVIFLMTFDTVLACQWIRHRHGVCAPAPSCGVQVVTCGPIISCYPTVVHDQPQVMGKGAGEGSPSDGYMVPSPAPLNSDTPQQPDMTQQAPGETSMPDAPVPDPIQEQPPGAGPDADKPTVPDEPADRGGTTPAEENPAVEAERDPMEEQPATDALDSLFDDPSPDQGEPAPANEAAPANDALDNLFDDPNDAEMPAEGEAEQAAPADDDALDNLFGDPADEGMPTEGGDEAAGDAIDDLFGEPEADDGAEMGGGMAAPQDDAADDAAGGLDDLFGEEPAGEPAADDPQGEGEGGEGEGGEGEGGDLFDDLFGDPPADDSSNEDEEDDLFSSVGTQVLSITPKREPVVRRRWTDDTGHYTIHGTLVALLDGKVRILKDNDRTCTVVLSRLSQQDLAYVTKVAMQYGQGVIGQLAER